MIYKHSRVVELGSRKASFTTAPKNLRFWRMLHFFATYGILIMMRREYEIDPLHVNGLLITKLIVDPHVDKHSDHINDDLIKSIVRHLDKEKHVPTGENEGFKYFASTIRHAGQVYKLIWLLEESFLYLGVITAFRDRRIK